MPQRCLLELDCRIKPEKRREFRLNIGASLRESTWTRGAAVIFEDQDEPGHILIVEEWASLQELQHYLSSDEFLAIVGGFKVLGVLHDCRIVDLLAGTAPAQDPAPLPRSLKGWRHVDIQASGDAR